VKPTREAILARIARELDRPPGRSARHLQFAVELDKKLWLPAAKIAKLHGIPVALLRRMREAGTFPDHQVGPRCRPCGHQWFYHVTEFSDWVAMAVECVRAGRERDALSSGV